MEIFGVDAWDEKKCVHASTLETGLMHGAERQELVHHFFGSEGGRRPRRGRAVGAGRGRPSAGGSKGKDFGQWVRGWNRRVARGRRAAVYSSQGFSMKAEALLRGWSCRTWVPNGFCFFRRGACDER